MKTVLIATALAALAVVQVPDHTYEKRFKDPSGCALTVEAVCSIQPDAIACWDVDGKASPEITQKVQSSLPNQVSLPFTYKEKNRYVVLKLAGTSVTEQIATPSDFYGAYPGLANKFGVDEPASTSVSAVHIGHVAMDPNATTFELPFTVTITQPGTAQIGLKKGDSGQLASINLTYQAAAKGRPSNFGSLWPMSGQRTWTLTYHCSEKLPFGMSFAAQACDLKGQAIWVVDAQGKPLLGTYDEERSKPNGKYAEMASVWAPMRYNQDQLDVSLNIDPKMVGSIRFWEELSQNDALVGIPADPLPSAAP